MKYRKQLAVLALCFGVMFGGCSEDSSSLGGTAIPSEPEPEPVEDVPADEPGADNPSNEDGGEIDDEDGVVEEEDNEDFGAEDGDIEEGEKIETCTASQCVDEMTLEQCKDGVASKIVCENGCDDGRCMVKEVVPAECIADLCSAGNLNQCIDGKIVPKTCEFGCLSGKCLPNPVVSLNGKKILFSGNSQTFYGRIVLCSSGRPSWKKKDKKVVYDERGFPVNNQGIFYYLAKSYGDDVKITNFVYGSAAIAGQRRNTGGNEASGDCSGIDTSKQICMSDSSAYKSKMYGQLEMMKTLHPHYYNYDGKGKKNMDPFYDQDYVVIQQIRNPLHVEISKDAHLSAIKEANPSFTNEQISNEATYQDSAAVAALFPPETEIAMMLTQWGSNSAYEEGINRTSAKGWTVVPYGHVARKLWSNEYSDMLGFRKYKKADFLITKDNSHPNFLVGYLGALGLYAALTNRAIVNDNFYTVEDTEAYAKNKIDRYYVRRESRAVANGYYQNTDETSFGNILSNDKEMTAIKRHLDGELAVYDNKLYKVTTSKAQSFGLVELKRPNNMTDRAYAYVSDKSSTYTTLQWAETAEAARNWKNAPHYDANGNLKSDGKYLAGFYFELPKEETVSKFKLFNPNTTVEIDGFDVLTSMDGQTWSVAWSGSRLSTNLRYILSGYSNTNYIQGNFYPVKAKYVMFALTAPRPQENVDVDAYNSKYHGKETDKKVTGVSSKPHTFNITEFEVYRYTAR